MRLGSAVLTFGAAATRSAASMAAAISVALILSYCPAWAGMADADSRPQTVDDLRNLSIEQLTELQVTSVSKRPEALGQAAAAIYVITAADIHRSGATSLPEVLRLAPNLEVAKINAYSWTVTARGFNSPETANKLLVLVDGRSVYEPIGSGVLWQQIDVALDNIDRIEVISGPGGTLWGANAVNGVINIITKDAADTQGLYARAAASPFRRSATVRFGGKLGEHASYRLFADSFDSGTTRAALASDTSDDAFQGVHGGFGIDGTAGDDTYTLKGDLYRNSIADKGGIFSGYDIVGGWSRDLTNGATVTLNAYADHDIRNEPTLYESRDTFNIDGQETMAIGAHQQFVWGGELRYWRENFVSFNAFHFANPKTTISLGSLFAQDEIALRQNVKLTLGLKAEGNSYSGLDALPNMRLAWQMTPDSLLWGAVSRAVRTPNRIERELEAAPFLAPSPDFQSEKLIAYELGWRAQPSPKSSFSLATFYNVYDGLRTDGITPVTVFPLVLQNGGHGVTYGLEGWGKYEVTPNWRLSGGFNLLHKHFNIRPGYFDAAKLAVGGQDPKYQAQLRSDWNVTKTVEFDLAMRAVGKIDNTAVPVPAYSEASFRLAWQVTDKVEFAVNASNLLHARHLEAWDPSTTSPRYIGRSILASLQYGF